MSMWSKKTFSLFPLSGSSRGDRSERNYFLLLFLFAVHCSLLTFLLAGCAVGPDFQRPAAPKVDRYTL